KRGTAPAELTWPRAPATAFRVTAKLAGHETAELVVDPAAFEEREEAMRASVQLSLNPLPEKPASVPKEPKPKPVVKPREPVDSETSAQDSEAKAQPTVPVEAETAPE